MPLDTFQMPSFKDPDGTVYIWDSASKSYVKAPLTDGRPDQSHATGGDNDLFDPFQHTEQDSVPELEGYMAARTSFIDEPPFPSANEVKCPNCGESTEEQICPTCQKDLTPEWNVHGQDNEFFGVHPEFNDAKEWRTWPQVVPKRNEFNYDDSFPSMSLSKTAEALPADDGWDDVFNDAAPMRMEVGKWILDQFGQIHVEHGTQAQHERIEARDGLVREQEIAVGSVYNDGTADVQAVEKPQMFNLEEAQGLIQQAFGPVMLQPPIGQAGMEVRDQVFAPQEIQGGQWFIPPHTQTITGVAWVKERPEGREFQPNMILVCEHLRPDDFALWSNGVPAIITAVGGGASHAAMLATTHNIPVITAIGDSYNKLQTGNYLKIEPTNETIMVMPAPTRDWSMQDKQQLWNSIIDYQRQRGGSVSQPEFSHILEEEQWRLANSPNLEECPECRAPMFDRDGEAQCSDCGHKQPIIHTAAPALALAPLAEGVGAEALGAGAAGGAGAGGGIGGIGGLMNGALGRGVAFRAGENMVGGGGGNEGGGGASAAGAPAPAFDPAAGTYANTKFAAANMRHEAVLSEIWALIQNALNAAKAGAGNIPWGQIGNALAANPIDDALFAGASGAAGAAHQHAMNTLQQATAALGDDEVGLATKNDGTNSTEEASNSSIEGKKEQGDGPEQLKDVDGGHDSQTPNDSDDLSNQNPEMQEKALKAFHMNLPLVIEFANSEEPGADNPILMALDAMLEEAFPGYKDGGEEGGAESEHPQEKDSETPEERDEDADEPDEKSEGSDKKEIHIHARLASTLHTAWDPDEGYASDHPYDDQPYDMSPGDVIAAYPDGTIVLDDGITTYNPERARQFLEQGGQYEEGDDLPRDMDDDQAYGEYEMYGPDRPTMEEYYQNEREGKTHLDDGVWHFAEGPSAWDVRDSINAPTQWGQPRYQDAPAKFPPQIQGEQEGWQQGAPTSYNCMNCGTEQQFPSNIDPRDLPTCPQCGEKAWTHSGLPQTYASIDPQQVGSPSDPGVPAGAGGATMQICPRCGQTHTLGSPCPVADVTTPLVTGDPQAQEAPNSNHVVTKWRLANPSMPASQPQMAAGAPAAPTTCPNCGCNHMPGTPCPDYNNMQQPSAVGQSQNMVSPPVGPGVAYSSAEHHDEDHGDYHSDDDWTDDSGSPLQEGAQYEMKTAHSPIPTRVTIEKIFPEKLTYLIHSGDVDYRDKITRDQVEFDGATFSAVDSQDTPEDSVDTFPGEEMPTRPGQDALPQEDDLSSPSTVMSAFEPISLDTYTGSFAGDQVDDRSWLMEDASPVEVDPALMAKFAGKDFSPREQREFIEEKGMARNLDRLDLEGTHYIDDELGTADSLW